jgi:drug/metabolite transporter (DMT)-like permease
MKQAACAERIQASFIITLLAATFLFGSSFVAGKILLQDGFPPMLLVGWRFVLAAFATLPLVVLDGRGFASALLPPGLGLRGSAVVALIGLTQTAGVMSLLFLAMQWISAPTAAILLFTNPIWVALLGKLYLAEPLSRVRIAGLVLGLIGVVLAIGLHRAVISGPAALTGELIGLGSAWCFAGATIINKRADIEMGPWSLTFWQMLIGALAVLVIAYAVGDRWPQRITVSDWAWFIWLAIPASTGSFGLWYVALRKGGATRTSGYLFLAPLFTVILSFMILGSTLTLFQAAGGVLIGLSLWLVNRDA